MSWLHTPLFREHGEGDSSGEKETESLSRHYSDAGPNLTPF